MREGRSRQSTTDRYVIHKTNVREGKRARKTPDPHSEKQPDAFVKSGALLLVTVAGRSAPKLPRARPSLTVFAQGTNLRSGMPGHHWRC